MKTSQIVELKSVKRNTYRNAYTEYLAQMPDGLRPLALNSRYPKNNIDLFTLIQFLIYDCKFILGHLEEGVGERCIDITDNRNERTEELYTALNIAYDDIISVSDYVLSLIHLVKWSEELDELRRNIVKLARSFSRKYEADMRDSKLKFDVKNSRIAKDVEIKAWFDPQYEMYENAKKTLTKILEDEFNSDDGIGDYSLIINEAPGTIIPLLVMTKSIIHQTEFLFNCR